MSVRAGETKEHIRKRIRERREAITEDWVGEASLAVIERVVRLSAFRSARIVGVYLALPREVQTEALVAMCRQLDKQVCVPGWDEKEKRYQMAWMNAETEMISGPMGIPQPRDPVWVDVERIEFMTVPGLAFDPKGGRLGHGGGHYDRLLSGCGGFKVGLAFEFQIVEQIPLGAHDVPVNVVITERMNYPDEGN